MSIRYTYSLALMLCACGTGASGPKASLAPIASSEGEVNVSQGVSGFEPESSLLLTNTDAVNLVKYRDRFTLPEPTRSDSSGEKTLWATWYNLHQGTDLMGANGAVPMRNLAGGRLGPTLSLRDWCFSAMEGSALIRGKDGAFATYNYAGTSPGNSVDCSKFFAHDVSKTKFHLASGPFGDGVNAYKLAPYRSIAVDKNQKIPFGTVLYISAARGALITLPDGSTVKHDGYFFAADTGGAIKKNHIDVFLGLSTTNPFKWIRSTASGTFRALVINDSGVIEYLRMLHM